MGISAEKELVCVAQRQTVQEWCAFGEQHTAV